MQTKRKTPDRAAVAKSLRELALLFGKKPPPVNESPVVGHGAGATSAMPKMPRDEQNGQ